MIKREIANKVLRFSKQYPVVVITGPRQSGKTTLAKMVFPKKSYVSLEDPDNRYLAGKDPRGFLDKYPTGAILDEIQRQPELLSYIQTRVDVKDIDGMFILTGSQQFELLEKITQSLAGRAAIVRLLPFSLTEIKNYTKLNSIDQILFSGFYPRIYDKKLNPTEALSFYVNTYIERDVRKILNISDLSKFETFIRLCAGRTGQLLNLNSLGAECGINHNTAKSWISVLEASYIVKLIKPYFRNLNQRLIKTPKLYFVDCGIASYLLNIKNPEQLSSHPLRGALFETLIISELLKRAYLTRIHDNIYFFRTHKGIEVDVVIDQGQKCQIAEIKSGKTIVSDFFKGLNFFNSFYKNVEKQYIIYGGSQNIKHKETHLLPWYDLPGIELY